MSPQILIDRDEENFNDNNCDIVIDQSQKEEAYFQKKTENHSRGRVTTTITRKIQIKPTSQIILCTSPIA